MDLNSLHWGEKKTLFIRTWTLRSATFLLLNLAFWFLSNLEARGQIDECDPKAPTTQCSAPAPHPESLLRSFVPSQPQHTQMGVHRRVRFAFLNAVPDNGQFV